MRALGAQIIPVLGLGPPSSRHAASDDGGEGVDRVVLVAVEDEKGGTIRVVTDDREGDDRHLPNSRQWTRLAVGDLRLGRSSFVGEAMWCIRSRKDEHLDISPSSGS